MGKIQSAITGLVMTSIGAVATAKKFNSLNQEQPNETEEEPKANLSKTKALGQSAKKQSNLINRSEEANEISSQFVKASTKQKQDIIKRIQELKGGNQ